MHKLRSLGDMHRRIGVRIGTAIDWTNSHECSRYLVKLNCWPYIRGDSCSVALAQHLEPHNIKMRIEGVILNI